MEVVVGLSGGQFGADKFVINLIVDIGEQNEGGDDTSISAGLELCRHITIPHVGGASDDSANSVGSHGQKDAVVVF